MLPDFSLVALLPHTTCLFLLVSLGKRVGNVERMFDASVCATFVMVGDDFLAHFLHSYTIRWLEMMAGFCLLWSSECSASSDENMIFAIPS